MFPVEELTCARLAIRDLTRLADLRCEPGLDVALAGEHLWVRWPPGSDRIPWALLPFFPCEFFTRHDGHWFSRGCALPTFDVPLDHQYRPLFQVLFPAPIQALEVPSENFVAVALRLERDTAYRPARALVCGLEALLKWAEVMPGVMLARYQAVISHKSVLAVGRNVPWVSPGERYWGERVLTPMGYRPCPCLPEEGLREAAGAGDDDLLVLHHDRRELIPQGLFSPLTHAALRRAQSQVRS